MKLDMALLADAAAGPPDGKLYIHGGGITRITALIQPWPQPSLAIVLRFLTESQDWGKPATISIELEDPAGDKATPPGDMPVEIPGNSYDDTIEGEQTALQIVLNLNNIVFRQLGLFTFTVLLDGDVVARLPLAVVAP